MDLLVMKKITLFSNESERVSWDSQLSLQTLPVAGNQRSAGQLEANPQFCMRLLVNNLTILSKNTGVYLILHGI